MDFKMSNFCKKWKNKLKQYFVTRNKNKVKVVVVGGGRVSNSWRKSCQFQICLLLFSTLIDYSSHSSPSHGSFHTRFPNDLETAPSQTLESNLSLAHLHPREKVTSQKFLRQNPDPYKSQKTVQKPGKWSQSKSGQSGEEEKSSVPVVPIQLPPPNATLHYHYADDDEVGLRFKTDFSRILLPFRGSREDMENPDHYLGESSKEYYSNSGEVFAQNLDFDDDTLPDQAPAESAFQGGFEDFEDFDPNSDNFPFLSEKKEQSDSRRNVSYLEKGTIKHKKVGQSQNKLKLGLSPQKQDKSKKPDKSKKLLKSVVNKKLTKTQKTELPEDDHTLESYFESKKIPQKIRKGYPAKNVSSISNSIPGSSLEDVSLSLNFDNGRQVGRQDKDLLRRRPRRSVVHLYDMVVCATGCNPLAYKGYGCYCGFLGSGLTVDGIDRCCAKHDWCYHHAKCPPFLTYFVPYYWTCNEGRPRCVTEYRGWKGVCGANLCECDRQFAQCLRKYPCPRSRATCFTSPWRFWQNLLMFPRYSPSPTVHHHY